MHSPAALDAAMYQLVVVQACVSTKCTAATLVWISLAESRRQSRVIGPQR